MLTEYLRNRIRYIQRLIKKDRLDAFLIFSNTNIRYLTGFEGSAGILIIFREDTFLLVDSRYTLKAKRESRGVKILTVRDYFEGLLEILNRKSAIRIGFEEEHLSYSNFRKLSLRLLGRYLIPYSGLIESQRACKDKSEIELIKESIGITEKALLSVVDILRPGVCEKEIADRLEDYLRRGGARGSSFRTMVAIPRNARFPHSEPGMDRVPRRGFVLVDIGCNYRGYNSDLTRIFVLDKMNSFEKEIVGIVLASQRKAIGIVRSGREARDIDRAGREVIEKKGFGKYFGHGIGHGVGLAIHEPPVLSGESKDILKEGMVITIEPGIYLPGHFGIRIEDMVLVTRRGGIRISCLPPVLYTRGI